MKTMHKHLHLTKTNSVYQEKEEDKDKFSVSRKGRRPIANTEDCEDATIQGLQEYTKIAKRGRLEYQT